VAILAGPARPRRFADDPHPEISDVAAAWLVAARSHPHPSARAHAARFETAAEVEFRRAGTFVPAAGADGGQRRFAPSTRAARSTHAPFARPTMGATRASHSHPSTE
jgi:hypothetical protein